MMLPSRACISRPCHHRLLIAHYLVVHAIFQVRPSSAFNFDPLAKQMLFRVLDDDGRTQQIANETQRALLLNHGTNGASNIEVEAAPAVMLHIGFALIIVALMWNKFKVIVCSIKAKEELHEKEKRCRSDVAAGGRESHS